MGVELRLALGLWQHANIPDGPLLPSLLEVLHHGNFLRSLGHPRGAGLRLRVLLRSKQVTAQPTFTA